MAKTYFYHSFPRRRENVSVYESDKLAMKILRSLLKRGLLLTAEERRLSGTGKLHSKRLVQQRICFTAIEPKYLTRHAKEFGRFSLEFEGDKLRAFGAQPVVYLAGSLPNIGLLNNAGNEVARHMLEAHNVLKALWKLRNSKDKGLVRAAARVTAAIHRTEQPFETFFFTLQALLNLYYPTDRAVTKPLHFFRQREWRIIPNFSYDRTWHYPKLKRRDRVELMMINPRFFGAKVGGKPQINSCLLFSRVGNRHIVKEARRIVVPDKFVSKAKTLVVEAGLSLRVAALSSVK